MINRIHKHQKKQLGKIVKEWNECTTKEVWDGVRDNFVFGWCNSRVSQKWSGGGMVDA
jgi:hypothetical protein